MPAYFTISTVREDIERYKKNNSYSSCCADLCAFFKGKNIEEVFSQPIIIYTGGDVRYLKSRIINSNNGRGKSNGYRLYYYVDRKDESVTLIGFYPKTGVYGMPDISPAKEKQLIDLFRKERDNKTLVRHDILKGFVLEPTPSN